MYRVLVVFLATALLLHPAEACAQIDPATPAGTLIRAETTAQPSYFRDSEGQIQFWMMVTDISFSKANGDGTSRANAPTSTVDTAQSPEGRLLELEVVFGGINESEAPQPILTFHTGYGSRPDAIEAVEAQHVAIGGNDVEGTGFRFVYKVSSDAMVVILSWLAPSEVTLMIDLRDEDPEYSRDVPQFQASDREGIAYKFTYQPQATMQIVQFSYANGPNDPLREALLWHETYVILNVEITNISDAPIELRAEEFYLWTSAGVVFKPGIPVPQSQNSRSVNDVNTKSVSPGESAHMTLFIPYLDTAHPVDIVWFMNGSWTVIPLGR